MMLRRLRHSLATSMVIQISSTVLVIYSIVLSYNYIESRKQISAYAEMHCRRVAESTANLIESKLDETERAAEDSVTVLIQNWDDVAFLKSLIEMIISQNLQLGGALLFFNPSELNDDSIIHINRTPRGLRQSRISDEILGRDSLYLKLYQQVREQGRSSWSAPTIEPVTGLPVMLFCTPVFEIENDKKRFKGAFTVELDLLNIEEITSGVKVFNTGFSFILSEDGTFIAYPFKDSIARKTVFDLAEEYNNRSLADVGKRMIRGETGFSILDSIVLKQESYVYYVPIPEYKWSLAVLCTKEDMFEGMERLSKQLIIIASAGFMILFLLVAYISGKITRPLRNLSNAAYAIGKGNLDFIIPRAKSSDEVGVLTNVFSDMRGSLKDHIKKLTETTAAKERIDRELQIAHEVQMSILPGIESLPAYREFMLHAMIAPAKEVGGDMYDFFMSDETTLWLAIGDVSGKGVPAAFLMAIAKTMLHTTALSDPMPGDVLTTVNTQMCRNNPYLMFITLFIAKLNIKTGIMHYSNAGHNPPAILSNTGSPSYLNDKIGPACGIQLGFKYGSRKTRLSPGNSLFMFTDGVTESLNAEGNLFSDERLHQILTDSNGMNPRDVIEMIMQSITAFAGNTPQHDDITMLTVKFNGPEATPINPRNARTILGNETENIERLHGFINDFCEAMQIDKKIVHELQLVMEEVFINICRYAYGDKSYHAISISLSYDGKEISWMVEDDGMQFNPLEHVSTDYEDSIEKIQIGGQGIKLVKNLSDHLDYKHVNGKNCLTGKKKVHEDSLA